MGVRLYPLTKDKAKLEQLAQVPPGTCYQLALLERKHNTHDDAPPAADFWAQNARWDAFYGELYQKGNENVLRLNGFLINGWGKFRDTYNITKGEYAGSEPDMVRAEMLLHSNGIIVPYDLTEGVYWC